MDPPLPLLFPSLQTHADSPLPKVPEPIKEIFMGLKFNVKEIKLQHPFEKVEMPTHVCSNLIKKNDKYFHCKQCCFDTDLATMVICQTCYQPAQHEGHEVQEKTLVVDTAMCDCGRSLRINDKSHCQTHSAPFKKPEISEADQTKFNEYFMPLLDIYLFLRSQEEDELDKLENALNKTLTELCHNSLFYIQLTASLLTKPYKQGSTYLLEILDSYHFESLVHALATDTYFLKEFALVFMQEQQKQERNLFPFKSARQEFLDCKEVLISLAEKNIFVEDKLSNYLRITEEGSQTYTMLMKFYESIQQKQEPKQFLMLLTKDFKKQSNLDNFGNFDIKPFLIHLFVKTMNEKINLSSADKEWFPETLTFICELLIDFCGKLEELPLLMDYFAAKNVKVSQENIDTFVEKLFDFEDLWNDLGEKFRTPILVLLILVKDHPKKNKLIKQMWGRVLADQSDFITNMEGLYNMISLLSNSYKTYPSLAFDESFQTKNPIELKEQIFRSYIYEQKELSRDKLWKEYNEGWLNFSTAPAIIKELCRYKDDTQTFIYDRPNKFYENAVMKIHETISRNWENIRGIQVTMNSQISLRNPVLKGIFLNIFQQDGFFSTFSERFNRGLAIVERDSDSAQKWKKKNLGEVYLLLLVIIHKFCDEKQSEFVKIELEQVINDPEQRFKFQLFGDRKRIYEILCIDDLILNEEDNMDQGKEQREQRQKDELKKKTQQKKNKLTEKFSQKRAATLQKFASKQSEQVQEEQELEECLLCHETAKKNKEMVFLANMVRGETVAQILHGQEVKTNTIFDTCFHTIHISCYTSMKKKNMSFNCPLCNKNVNCFLPINPESTSKKVWNQCWNFLNALLVAHLEITDVQSLFSLFFDAYIENKGISRIIMEGLQTSDLKRKEKVGYYFESLITNSFERSKQFFLEEYTEQYNQLLAKVETCEKEQFKIFQRFVIKCCWQSINDGYLSVDEPALKELFGKMDESEALVLVKILKELSGETAELDYANILKQAQEASKVQPESESNQEPSSQTEQEQPAQKKMVEKTQQQAAKKETPKYRFGINLLRPRKTISELIADKNGQACSNCQGEEISSQCMICQKYFCSECEDDEIHKQTHCSKIMSLYFSDGCVKLTKGRENSTVPIYFNDFMISYKKGKGSDKHNTTYWLNEQCLDKAINEFLNIKV